MSYDLQVAALARFLHEPIVLRDVLRDSRFRLLYHFDSHGRQPEERKGIVRADHCCFNLQNWMHLARLAESCGEDLWGFVGGDSRGIRVGMQRILSRWLRQGHREQMATFDTERFYPIYYACAQKFGLPSHLQSLCVPKPEEIKPLFAPRSGIPPFWQLRLHEAGSKSASTAGLELGESRDSLMA